MISIRQWKLNSASEVYECYVAYYNYTRTPEERVRIAVFADWSKEVKFDGKGN